MTTENIIAKLRDDKEYYSGIGKDYLSNSDIGVLLSNPKDFGKPRKDEKHFAEGRYFHQLLIEPEKAIGTPFVDVSTRNTKEYKKFCEENNHEFVLLRKEMEEMESLASIIKGNIAFYDEIYNDGNQYEKPSVGVIHGMNWKGKTDIETPEILIDLKTTSDIGKFKYSARSYNYDSQAFIYQELFGKPLVFYVIDKGSGQLGIFRPTNSFIESGELKVKRAIQVWEKFFGPNPTDDIANYYIDEVLE